MKPINQIQPIKQAQGPKPVKPLSPQGKMAPLVKPVSTKPSDRPTRMAAVTSSKLAGTNPVTKVPDIPAIVPKKVTRTLKPTTRRPGTGMK